MRSSSISDQPYKGLVCKSSLNFKFLYFSGWVGGCGELKLISADDEAGKLTKGSPLNCSYCGRKNNNKNSLEIKVTLSSGVNILGKIINSSGTWFLDNRNSTGFLYVNFGYI